MCFLGAHAEVTTVEVQVLGDVERAVEGVGLRHDADHLLGGGRAGATTSMPPTHASPDVGMTRVVSMPTVVVLPAPLGPSSPKISPLCTARSRSPTARTSPPRPSNILVSATVRMTPSSSAPAWLGTSEVARRSPWGGSYGRCVQCAVARSDGAVPTDGAVATWVALSILRPVSGGVTVTFFGVRGSTPCTGPEFERYGGHSSCVVLEAEDQPPILLDLGTGLRPYGMTLRRRRSTAPRSSRTCTGTTCRACRSSLPLHREGSTLDIYGPRQADGPLGDVFAQMMRPPFFPIRPTDLPADVRFHDTGEDDFPVGLAKVRSRWVRHVGADARLPRRVERHVGRVPARSRSGHGRRPTPTTTSRPACSSSATGSTC